MVVDGIEFEPAGFPYPEITALLRKGLGIEVGLRLVSPGETSAETQIDTRQKPIRLIDQRSL